MLILLILSFALLSHANPYDVPNCLQYKSLIYNAPCVECRAGFQLIKEDNFCQQCKDQFKEVNGKCVIDYSYVPPPTQQQQLDSTRRIDPLLPTPSPSFPTTSQDSSSKALQEQTVEHCNDYDLIGRCVKCKNNYELDKNNFCQPIQPTKKKHCKVYDDLSDFCFVCEQGYQLDNTGICMEILSSQTSSQFYSLGVDFCVRSVNGSCELCEPDYTLNRTMNRCQNSTNSTDDMDDNEQVYMDENCQKMNEEKTLCLQCIFLYYFDQDQNICKVVSPFCKDFDGKTGACTDCFFSFKLQNGECVLVDNP